MKTLVHSTRGSSAHSHVNRPRVGVIVETTMSCGRQLLLGVSEYVRQGKPWSVSVEALSLNDSAHRWLQHWHGDGIICSVPSPALAKAIRRTGIPTVSLEVGLPDVETILGEPPVVNDHEAIGRMAAEHLIDRGFRTFGYFGCQAQRWSDLRCQGFRDTVVARGFPCEEYRGRRKPTRGYRVRLGEREMDDAARWIRELPKPVGLLASHDYLAMQLLEACGRAGVSVPEEAAVIGVDDDDLCCALAVPLSSVAPDSRRIGFEAARLLDSMMRGRPSRATPLRVSPLHVAVRQSSDVTAIDDAIVAKALRFIRGHACEGINVENVLRELAVSRSVLQLRFRKALGRSVHDAILGERIRGARKLLQATDLPLRVVAERSGFRHVEYFCSAFKQRTGQTPGRYRASRSPSSA